MKGSLCLTRYLALLLLAQTSRKEKYDHRNTLVNHTLVNHTSHTVRKVDIPYHVSLADSNRSFCVCGLSGL